MKKFKISFCTSCTNRLHHIKETFINNLEKNIDYGDVEFVLLNWNSRDGMDDWVSCNLQKYIESGVVKYLHSKKAKEFEMARTKNVTARNASGDIVCWVDGDNFLSKDYAFYLNDVFNKNQDIILNNIVRVTKKREAKSNWGRIAMLKKYFTEVNGYDETFKGWGWEERDFKQRIIGKFKLNDVKFEKQDCNYIEHKNTFNRPRRTNIDNRNRAYQNMKNKKFVVNEDHEFGSISDLKIIGGQSW
jgi:predicted glycosyltransferase involved in capsule biosynthesis